MALRYRALLLGNWEYKHLKPLFGPKSDVELVRQALVNADFGLFKPENVTVAPANLKTIPLAETIESFLEASDKDDYLLIYYSGHGGLRTDNYLALCGVDTKSVDSTAFDTRQLPGWIDEKARGCPTILVLDCCFAGQVGAQNTKGPGPTTAISASNIPDGLLVLASSGRTVSPAASAADKPSPFTAQFASILTDPKIRGDYSGMLTGTQVYEELRRLLPDQRPQWKGHGTVFGLARRPRPQYGAELPGWPELQKVETIELSVTSQGVQGSWTDDGTLEGIERFDPQRQWAIRRLTELADGVIRQGNLDHETVDAVRKAWECIGSNLFASIIPQSLQERIRQPSTPRDCLVKLRLSVPDRPFADLPWEYLHDDDAPASDGFTFDSRSRTLGRRPGMLIERAAPPLQVSASSSSGSVFRVLAINTYNDPLEAAGDRVHADLDSVFGPDLTMYLKAPQASRMKVNETLLLNQSDYLVLMAPLQRQREMSGQPKLVKIGFAQMRARDADFHPARAFVGDLVDSRRVFKCIVLITYAAQPGRDSYRGAVALAGQLAAAGRGPVAFVCHEQPYLDYLIAEPEAPTFAGLLIRALEHDKPLDQAFAWARDRIIQLAGEPALSFGLPGLYAPRQEELVGGTGASMSSSSLSVGAAPLASSKVSTKR